MKAIRFHYRPASYLATRYAGRRAAAVALSRLGSVRLDDVAPVPLPASDWVRVRTTLSGVCGSDLSALTAHDSFTLEPFGAYPFTFGHENVGTIAELGPEAAGGWRVGDRVIVNPMLACRQRALAACPPCARGDYGLCRNTDRGTPGRGPMIGYCPGTGGGWAGSFVAHVSQLHAADGLSDDVALLTDPYASALRGVLLHPPREADAVLVVGAGTIGVLTVHALRATGWTGELAVIARHPFQGELAAAAGASRVFASVESAFAWAEAQPDARGYKPSLAPRFVEGGPSLLFDTVGTAASIRDTIALAREGGRIVLVGAAARVAVDFTRVWYRQLTIAGIFAYGSVPFEGAHRDVYEATIALLRRSELARLGLVTHVHPLEEYRAALAAALDKGGARSVKVAFRPNG
jgi:threonine dehydrogenase-like Zn-dependent dehydrogenase